MTLVIGIGTRIRSPSKYTEVEDGETGVVLRPGRETGYWIVRMDKDGRETEWWAANFNVIEDYVPDTKSYADYYTAVTEYSEEG